MPKAICATRRFSKYETFRCTHRQDRSPNPVLFAHFDALTPPVIQALKPRGIPVVAGEDPLHFPEAMKPEFIVLTLILLGAIYLFWTQRLRTDIAALLVMLSMALPWPRPDGKWSAILSPQEAFSGFGSVAVIMVTAMFVFSAAMVRTGAAEMIGGRLFRACAHNELLLQIAVLFVAAAFSMFINETTIVLVFMPVVLGVCKERNLSPSRYLLCAAYGAALGGQWTLIGTRSNIIVSNLLRQRTVQGINFFDFTPIAATVFVGCAIYFFLVGRRFLPKAEVQSLEQELGKDYLTEVMGYAAIGHRRINPRPTRLG